LGKLSQPDSFDVSDWRFSGGGKNLVRNDYFYEPENAELLFLLIHLDFGDLELLQNAPSHRPGA
jgi:hypothetical protein